MVSRSPVFYGWVVWVVATIGMIGTAPGQSYSVSLFIDSIMKELAIGRTTISGLYGLGTFLASLSLTWVGRNVDRHGNRLIGTIIGVLFAISLVAFSRINSVFTLLLGFILIRALGQGSGMIVSSTAINQWFQRYRGRVLSVTIVLYSLFQSVYVTQLQNAIEKYDWRQIWVFLGIGIAVLIPTTMWFFMRNRPEDYGLNPDGVKNESEATENAVVEVNWTLKQARKTSIFWIFFFAQIIQPTFTTGLVFHQVSIFGQLGYEPMVAAQTYGKIAIIAAISSVFSGFIVDAIQPKRIQAIHLSALTLVMCMALIMREPWMLWIYAAAYGFANAIGAVYGSTIWATIFGRKYQGAIRGFVTTSQVVGSAVGPLLFGLSYDLAGGYHIALYFGIGLAVISFVSSFFIKIPTTQVA